MYLVGDKIEIEFLHDIIRGTITAIQESTHSPEEYDYWFSDDNSDDMYLVYAKSIDMYKIIYIPDLPWLL